MGVARVVRLTVVALVAAAVLLLALPVPTSSTDATDPATVSAVALVDLSDDNPGVELDAADVSSPHVSRAASAPDRIDHATHAAPSGRSPDLVVPPE